MTAAVLLDHVSAYAAAVRAHLHDLSPEQVDDLTDGLEADLAAALEDGPAEPSEGSHTLDLTRRFGPAADYADELRVAAGLAPTATGRPRLRHVLADRRRARRERWRARADRVVAPVTAHRQWPAVREFAVSLRPAWWLLRAWVWFVVLVWLFRLMTGSGQALTPNGVGTTLLLLGLAVVSVNLGRGRLPVPPRLARGVRIASVGAAVLAVPFLVALADRVDAGPYEYETVLYQDPYVQDGVYVDGTRVSNLFVYDAEGAPLTGVQVVDDRGRPVRTFTDDDHNEWFLPGLDDTWGFVPAVDVNGRPRWNVYPLRGAPNHLWEWDDEDGLVLPGDVEPQEPPVPFAAAPAVVVPGLERPADGDRTDDGEVRGAAQPSGSPSPAPSPTGDPTTGPDEPTAPDATRTPDATDAPDATDDPTGDGTTAP